MLLLFELGMGLFIEAKDIPAEVWAIVVGFGMLYVVSVCIAEAMQTARTDKYVVGSDDCIRSE